MPKVKSVWGRCVVPNCENQSDLFNFPSDRSRKEKWLESLNLNEKQIKLKNPKICIKHFKPSDVNITFCKKQLSRNATPILDIACSNGASNVLVQNLGENKSIEPIVPIQTQSGVKRKILDEYVTQIKFQKLNDSTKNIKKIKRQLNVVSNKIKNLKEAYKSVQQQFAIEPRLNTYLEQCAGGKTYDLMFVLYKIFNDICLFTTSF